MPPRARTNFLLEISDGNDAAHTCCITQSTLDASHITPSTLAVSRSSIHSIDHTTATHTLAHSHAHMISHTFSHNFTRATIISLRHVAFFLSLLNTALFYYCSMQHYPVAASCSMILLLQHAALSYRRVMQHCSITAPYNTILSLHHAALSYRCTMQHYLIAAPAPCSTILLLHHAALSYGCTIRTACVTIFFILMSLSCEAISLFAVATRNNLCSDIVL